MNLVIDIGNTCTKFALFNKGEMMISVPVDEFLPEHVTLLKEEHPSLSKVLVSSVKDYSIVLKEKLIAEFPCFLEFNENTHLPIENHYQTKETLGKDRLAAVVGANSKYPNENILVIDAGTAITYDIITNENKYLGGNISPGLQMRFKALNTFTGKLPLVCLDEGQYIYGNTTETAIRAGVQNGVIHEVEGTINLFKEFYENLKIFLTGGDANFFDKRLKNSFFVDLNLVTIGLNRILEHNIKIKKDS